MVLVRSALTFILMTLVACLAVGQEQIGPHTPLFTLEKNRNPENIMVIYTQLDSICRLKKSKGGKNNVVFDFYWMMDHKRFKPVNPIIKSEIRKRLELSPSNSPHSFTVVMNNLKEVDTDIKDFNMQVVAHKEKDACVADSFLTLGQSDKNVKIKLQSIYAESKGLLMPTIVAVTVKGINVATGEKIERKYLGR